MPRSYNLFLTLIFLAILASCTEQKPLLKYQTELDPNKSYDVIIMAGQSNMVGLGDVTTLENDSLPDNIIYINHGTDTNLDILHNTFGPEVSLSQYLSRRFPKRDFILLKYAIGGSSIQDWLDLTLPKNTKKKISKKYLSKLNTFTEENLKGINHKVIALLWTQGETDAMSEELSLAYERYFSQLITDFREAQKNKNLPVIYSEVSATEVNAKAKQLLNKSLLKISKTIPNTYFTRTNDLKMQSDNLHYTESSLLILGERFGTILENVIVLERDN